MTMGDLRGLPPIFRVNGGRCDPCFRRRSDLGLSSTDGKYLAGEYLVLCRRLPTKSFWLNHYSIRASPLIVTVIVGSRVKDMSMRRDMLPCCICTFRGSESIIRWHAKAVTFDILLFFSYLKAAIFIIAESQWVVGPRVPEPNIGARSIAVNPTVRFVPKLVHPGDCVHFFEANIWRKRPACRF
ncbi:hypothetical protein CC1G_15589 [Coprinopsis cinerea okayama7|uniref:Uncharacterized protein n=1 Tax=Coprinopsis cinerea (strain Okayama-7 / 130 / ATCC MYA-4618 / FGSC 9003) TaxID=240176 RepID=D6RN76_COPC7|nr:hypothetical protein CC1G_15589 [Coprinopsis cinerea okayama7\|eukprot:XP_002911046.1 hypothetical protein CC1G_15589 [Coprinopsis cinerea okayama7\